jgi:hypothetical protein
MGETGAMLFEAFISAIDGDLGNRQVSTKAS